MTDGATSAGSRTGGRATDRGDGDRRTGDGEPNGGRRRDGPADDGGRRGGEGRTDRRERSDGAEPEFDFGDVTLVMGTYDEEEAVETVLADVDRVTDGRAEVVCVDGSSDRTPELARAAGARVIEQEPQGYGVALARGIEAADRPVVVTSDCDDTYPMESLPTLLAELNDGADVVSADRLSRGADPMPPLNRAGNRAFAALASALVGRRLRDTTTGMRAYRRSVLESIEWTENTGLSAELLLRPVLRGYDVREVPVDYRERAGETTLAPVRGGAAIAGSILRVAVEEHRRRLGTAGD